MHYGINPLLLSMQKLGPRMKCACCCLSHYCHCAIWAMLSCRVISSILHTLTGPVDGASSRVLSSLFPLSSSGRSWVSVSIRLFPHCHCFLSSRRGGTETAVTQTNITTQVLAQQTHWALYYNSYLSSTTSQMKNESQAVTWIRYITVSQLLKLQQNTGTGHWT